MTDPRTAGRLARRLEPLHALSYFAPEVDAEVSALGVRRGLSTYFAARSAPMGRVTPGVVAAAFGVFNPSLVAHLLPPVWEAASPQDVTAARYRGVRAVLGRLLTEEVVASPEVAETADLLRAASAGCTVPGRPLHAAHAGLAWPDEPVMVLWHALALLREHRGDGHVAVLETVGLGGLDGLVTHTATGRGFTRAAAQRSRGWSEQDWADAEARLADRGLLDGSGALTDAGSQLRHDVEAETDAAGVAPWDTLSDTDLDRLTAVAVPLAHRVVRAGAFPEGVFA